MVHKRLAICWPPFFLMHPLSLYLFIPFSTIFFFFLFILLFNLFKVPSTVKIEWKKKYRIFGGDFCNVVKFSLIYTVKWFYTRRMRKWKVTKVVGRISIFLRRRRTSDLRCDNVMLYRRVGKFGHFGIQFAKLIQVYYSCAKTVNKLLN